MFGNNDDNRKQVKLSETTVSLSRIIKMHASSKDRESYSVVVKAAFDDGTWEEALMQGDFISEEKAKDMALKFIATMRAAKEMEQRMTQVEEEVRREADLGSELAELDAIDQQVKDMGDTVIPFDFTKKH